MANASLFSSIVGALRPQTDTTNLAGAPAYALSPRHALAQYAVTGCLNSTFYASATAQLEKTLELATQATPEFLARTAVYCRTQGKMKDMPALLAAILAARDVKVLDRVFDRVIDDAKMLRNFVQIVRSGVTGRKSFGSAPRRLVRRWFETRSDDQVFRACVGQKPSLADVIKMVHPRPATPSRAALYAWLIGRPHDAAALPALVREFEAFKAGEVATPPDVPFQMLTALELREQDWSAIARRLPWNATRLNLNTLARHGVFQDRALIREIANRLRDPEQVRKARCFPYALMTAFVSADPAVPEEVRDALQDAMELALANVPQIEGRIYVLPDVSGSMHSPVTGHRPGATTAVRCLDVAALVAAALLRANRKTEIIAFHTEAVPVRLNPRDSVLTNAAKLAALPSGGTNCSAPLAHLNAAKAQGDLVIFVSDNESWMDAPTHGRFGGSATATMQEWEKFRSRNPAARLVCLDLQPAAHTQAKERSDILNVGGFSDAVFDLIAAFARGELGAEHWVGRIEKIEL